VKETDGWRVLDIFNLQYAKAFQVTGDSTSAPLNMAYLILACHADNGDTTMEFHASKMCKRNCMSGKLAPARFFLSLKKV
jgi:hypothetical protein